MCEHGHCECGWVLPFAVEFVGVSARDVAVYVRDMPGHDVGDVEAALEQWGDQEVVVAECRDAEGDLMAHTFRVAREVVRDGGISKAEQRGMILQLIETMRAHGSYDDDALALGWYADDEQRRWICDDFDALALRTGAYSRAH